MLFSDAEVVKYINAKFEPTWKSLRPVPKVSIDFGNGKTIERTLNGNIATFVCTADGTIVDVVAGIYSAGDYLAALKRAEKLAVALPKEMRGRDAALRAYHVRESIDYRRAFLPSKGTFGAMLAEDTVQNELGRRVVIHRKLASNPNVKPNDVMHWLYREVLHADLDDPYLGLKPVLFATYPFKDELKN